MSSIMMLPFPFSIVDGALKSCPTSNLKLWLSNNLLMVENGTDRLTIVGKIKENERLQYDEDNYEDIDGELVDMLTEEDVAWVRKCCRIDIQDGLRMTKRVEFDIPRAVTEAPSVVPLLSELPALPALPSLPSVASQFTPIVPIAATPGTPAHAQAEVRRHFEQIFTYYTHLYQGMSCTEDLILLITRSMKQEYRREQELHSTLN